MLQCVTLFYITFHFLFTDIILRITHGPTLVAYQELVKAKIVDIASQKNKLEYLSIGYVM